MASENVMSERFRSIQHAAANGNAYWSGRELMVGLAYADWRNFFGAVEKAKESCSMAGYFVVNHFVETTEMVDIGSGAKRERENVLLSRYASYLVAMNGDPGKPEVAAAQAYFAEQTYRQEQQEELSEEERRVILREQVTDGNRRLNGVAQSVGVRSRMFGVFHDAGYRGLYGGMGLKDIKLRKGIPEKESLLDCINPSELAANAFRVTQTEEKLKRERIRGERSAIDAHHDVGKKVRETILELGGIMPESHERAPSIKKLRQTAKPKELPK